MKELNAKLIISDFDGTLITSNHEVTKEVKNSIDEYIANGGIFAVITGRMLASILPQVRKLGLKGLVAGYQGTVIADIESGQIIRCGGFEVNQTYEICKQLEDIAAHVNAYCGNDFYTDLPEDNKYLKLYEDITGVKANHVNMPLSQYVMQNNLRCQKVTSLCSPKDKQALYERLCNSFKDKYDVTYSADVLVEISPLGDNKGAALKFIADYYGIDIADTVAVGDNLNDLPMIEKAGVGVAVGNATAELKKYADYITVTNDEGAIAKIIEKFGYKQEI
jgi:hypothetical protein